MIQDLHNLHENNLREWLPRQVRYNNLTVVEFCQKLNVARALYYQYLNDESRPSKAMVRKMADVLDCSPKEIEEQVRVRKKFYARSQIESHLPDK